MYRYLFLSYELRRWSYDVMLFVSSSNMHVELHCWLVQPRQRMALELFLYKPSHDTCSANWSVHTKSAELKERHAWVHTDFPQEMWNMLLFGGKITFFFFLFQVLFNIQICIKTRYPCFTTRQAHPEWIRRSPLSWLWLLKFLISFRSNPNIHLLIVITHENPLFSPCDLFT